MEPFEAVDGDVPQWVHETFDAYLGRVITGRGQYLQGSPTSWKIDFWCERDDPDYLAYLTRDLVEETYPIGYDLSDTSRYVVAVRDGRVYTEWSGIWSYIGCCAETALARMALGRRSNLRFKLPATGRRSLPTTRNAPHITLWK
jgi:hypothetical protein